MRYRYAATSFSKTVNTRASYVGCQTRTTYSPFVLLLLPPLCSKRAESGRGKSCYKHIDLFAWFSRHNFRTQYFYESRYFKNQASVALNPLVSLFGRLVARSGRISGNRQTDGQTYRPTLAAHARRGLMKLRTLLSSQTRSHVHIYMYIPRPVCCLLQYGHLSNEHARSEWPTPSPPHSCRPEGGRTRRRC